MIVKVPFSEADRNKKRPAVVLSSHEHNRSRLDLVVANISSGSKAYGFWELDIDRWSEAGLERPSKVVCDHLSSVPRATAMLVGRLGILALTRIRRRVASLLGL